MNTSIQKDFQIWISVPLKIWQYLQETHMFTSLSYKVAGLKSYNCIKKRLQYKCFPVNFGKFLRTTNIEKQLQTAAFVQLFCVQVLSGYSRMQELILTYLASQLIAQVPKHLASNLAGEGYGGTIVKHQNFLFYFLFLSFFHIILLKIM